MTLSSETITLEQFAKTIDHSLLQPQLTEADVIAGCKIAAQYHAASVCVKPYHVKLAEAQQAMDDGSVKLDMVINYGQLRSGYVDYVAREVKAICDLAHAHHVKLKVIFENAHLTDEQKIAACQLCESANADWVKTSTGFAPTGATVADIKLMRANVSEKVQVKAAHGVRTLAAALEMIDAGVTRIGATATATMCDDFVKWRSGELKLERAETAGGY